MPLPGVGESDEGVRALLRSSGVCDREGSTVKRHRVIIGGLTTAALLLSACGTTGNTAADEILVSAASSLTEAFTEMESAFESANPEIDVVLNTGGSSALREQILAGAPADVFASANTANMDRIVDAGDVEGEPAIFARNRLEIAVPTGNPGGVTGLADFARDELLIGLCAESVPCGDYGRQALQNAGVTPAVDTEEPNVRALLTKIEVGELDAGIVYATDVASTKGGVDGVEVSDEDNVYAEYPIAVLAEAPNADGAANFVAFVLSDQGRSILADHGFALP
ncbi:MAG: molybdate ABC transporter substrate-binding protein [Actinomycetota bacterium]|nr:molybdate ABC transporter substrate-binding protein [Actinomycetota bacterium]